MICRKALCANLLYLLFYIPAIADDFLRGEPIPTEVATVERCLSHSKDRQDRFRCIGSVSRSCRDSQDGATTIGSAMCYTREGNVWDHFLNVAYKQIMESAEDDSASYIKSAQVSWIKYRNQACAWPYTFYRNGSMARPLSAECFMTQTALRTFDLLDIRDRDK